MIPLGKSNPSNTGTDSNPTDTILCNNAQTPYVLAGSSYYATRMMARLTHATAGQQLIRCVVYNNNAGVPGTFKAVTIERAINSVVAPAATWLEFPFASPVLFDPGTYHVGIWFGTVTTNVALINYFAFGGTPSRFGTATYSSGGNPPDAASWTAPGTANVEYDVFVALETAGEIPPPRLRFVYLRKNI